MLKHAVKFLNFKGKPRTKPVWLRSRLPWNSDSIGVSFWKMMEFNVVRMILKVFGKALRIILKDSITNRLIRNSLR